MKHIPLRECDREELSDWTTRANEILEELKEVSDPEERRKLIDKYKKHWRRPDLLAFLNKLSDGKCWYTEARFAAEYPQVEHFRPKKNAWNEHGEPCHEGYWWLAFDVDNYRLSKPMPNVRKGTYFPLRERALAVSVPGIALTRESCMLIDPIDSDDVDLISFNALGQPEPCPDPVVDLDDWDIDRVNFSIHRYGLDNPELCDLRKGLWIAIDRQLNEYAAKLLEARRNQCAVSKGQALEIRKQLECYLKPSHEFTRLVRSCFKSSQIGARLLPGLL